MGAKFSNLNYFSSSSSILTFHSIDKWNAHINATIDRNKLMVIYFTATWCGQCKYMEPIIKEFAAKYTDVEFIKIDVDELKEVAETEQFQVQALPTFILIKKSEIIDKLAGARKEELQKQIEIFRDLDLDVVGA